MEEELGGQVSHTCDPITGWAEGSVGCVVKPFLRKREKRKECNLKASKTDDLILDLS